MPWLKYAAPLALSVLASVTLVPAADAQRVTELPPNALVDLDLPCPTWGCYLSIAALDGTTAAAEQVGAGVALLEHQSNGTWVLQQSLQNPDEPPVSGQPVHFGAPLALDADTLLVTGTGRKYNFKPVIYVWTRNGQTWSNTQVLALTRPAGFDTTRITRAVMHGTKAAISGVRTRTATSENLAQIDIFVRRSDGRLQQQALLNPPTGQSSEYGYQLALEGNRLLVGDPAADNGAGRVYVYEFSSSSGWRLRRTLTAADASAGAGFGTAVAISGNTLAIGAPRRPNFDSPLRSGAAYLFQRTASGWAQTQLLVHRQYEAGEVAPTDPSNFGGAVALSGDRLIVQNRPEFPYTSFEPLAYLYERRGVWAPVAGLASPSALASETLFLSDALAVVDAFESVRYGPSLSFDLPDLWTLPPRAQ